VIIAIVFVTMSCERLVRGSTPLREYGTAFDALGETQQSAHTDERRIPPDDGSVCGRNRVL